MTEAETRWSVQEVLPLLRKVSLFEGLPDDDLERVASLVHGTTAEEGEILFEEGEPGDGYYVVHSGAVEIVVEGADGEEKLAVRRTGEGFGEMALIDDSPRSATARVAERAEILVIGREDFRSVLGEDTLALRMLEALAGALRALDVRFAARKRRAGAGSDAREISRTLQRGLLPRNAPKVEGYEIAAGTSLEDDGEGRTVWDTFSLTDGRPALVSLLVRGHGLPPSHYLGVARALLRELARGEARPTELLRRVNEGVADSVIHDGEYSVECGMLVLSDGEAVWTGAGRPAGAVLRRDGNFEELPSHGPPLGMMGGFRYGTERIELGQGDVVLVLSEASRGLFRGAADLVATLQGKPVGEVVSTVHRALRKAHESAVPETTVLYARKK